MVSLIKSQRVEKRDGSATLRVGSRVCGRGRSMSAPLESRAEMSRR